MGLLADGAAAAVSARPEWCGRPFTHVYLDNPVRLTCERPRGHRGPCGLDRRDAAAGERRRPARVETFDAPRYQLTEAGRRALADARARPTLDSPARDLRELGDVGARQRGEL